MGIVLAVSAVETTPPRRAGRLRRSRIRAKRTDPRLAPGVRKPARAGHGVNRRVGDPGGRAYPPGASSDGASDISDTPGGQGHAATNSERYRKSPCCNLSGLRASSTAGDRPRRLRGRSNRDDEGRSGVNPDGSKMFSPMLSQVFSRMIIEWPLRVLPRPVRYQSPVRPDEAGDDERDSQRHG